MLCYQEDVYLPFSYQRYMLDKKGNVIEGETKLEIKVTGNVKTVRLDWVDGIKDYPYSLILAVCCFKIKIPSDRYSCIELVFKDGDSENISFNNLFYRFTTPIESKEFPGYYYVPYYTEFIIREDGETISLRLLNSRKILKPKKWTVSKPVASKNIKGGYFCGRGKRDHDEVNGSSRHRFIALTFIPYTTDPMELVVNHKNGIPGDDRKDNLEWCSYSENTKHAYRNNLHPSKVRKVVVLDEKTGIEKKYPSVSDCSAEIGLSHSGIFARMNKTDVGYTDGIRIKDDDGLPWPAVSVRRSPSVSRKVLAKDYFSGKVCVFENAARASEEIGVKRALILFHCKFKPKTPTKGFSFRFSDDDTHWPHESEYHLRMYRRHQHGVSPYGLFLLDSKDSIIAFYECYSDFSKESGIPTIKIASMVKNKEPWRGLSLRRFDVKGVF